MLGGAPRTFERFLVAYLRNVPAAAALIRETIRFRAEDKLDSGAAPKLSLDSTFICPARQGALRMHDSCG